MSNSQSPAVLGAMVESKRLIALPSGVTGGRSRAFEDSVRGLLAQIASGTSIGGGVSAEARHSHTFSFAR